MYSWSSKKPRKQTDFIEDGKSDACMIHEYFRARGNHESVLDISDLINVTLRGNDVQGVDTRWDEIHQSITEIPQDNILESLYTMRLRESQQLKTTSAICTKDKVQESEKQKIRDRNFDARNNQIARGALVKQKVSVKSLSVSLSVRPGLCQSVPVNICQSRSVGGIACVRVHRLTLLSPGQFSHLTTT